MVRPLSSKSSKLLTSRGTNWGADATSAWGNGNDMRGDEMGVDNGSDKIEETGEGMGRRRTKEGC